MSKTVKIILCIILAAIALTVAIYPLISNVINEKNRSLVETSYASAIADLNEFDISAAKEAAFTYNKKLFDSPHNSFSKEALEEAEENYDSLLNVQGDGLMAYLSIPKISVELPVYHGTDEEILNIGIGHLLGSSLPVGGKNTHTVLTGHSGMSGQKLLSDLNLLTEGDVFYLRTLDETLAYKVDSIDIVLPEDISHLRIDAEEDSCTLVTCTPYGTLLTCHPPSTGGRYRFLVFCERVTETSAPNTEPLRKEIRDA